MGTAPARESRPLEGRDLCTGFCTAPPPLDARSLPRPSSTLRHTIGLQRLSVTWNADTANPQPPGPLLPQGPQGEKEEPARPVRISDTPSPMMGEGAGG